MFINLQTITNNDKVKTYIYIFLNSQLVRNQKLKFLIYERYQTLFLWLHGQIHPV